MTSLPAVLPISDRASLRPVHTDPAVGRLHLAAAALEQQVHRWRRPRHGRRIRRLQMLSVALLAIPMLLVLFFTEQPVPAAQALSQPAKNPSPLDLRQRGTEPSRSAESLAEQIRGYYARIPGGFPAAMRQARQMAQDHPLREFPPLDYDLLAQKVPIQIGPVQDDEPSESRRYLGTFNPETGEIWVLAGLSPGRTQEVREHELTHAWQFANCPRNDPQAVARWRYQFRQPLGSSDAQEQIIACMYSSYRSALFEDRFTFRRDSCSPVHYVRGYLSRPIEVDPRLAAFKRWWAWNHGELLDTPEKARKALEHPRPGDLASWPDASQAILIWDTFRNQPDIREILLRRMLQLL